MVLSFTPVLSNAPALDAGQVCCFDDGPSMIRRIQVLANGSLVEDCDQVSRATNIEVYSNAGKEWYNHDGSFMNYWRLNESLSTPAGVTAATNDLAQNGVLAHGYANSLDLSGSAFQMGIPVGLLAPSLRSEKYWPLRNMGELVLQITTSAATEAIWCNVAGSPSYTLYDIFLEVNKSGLCAA